MGRPQKIWRPQPDLNRCCRRERPVSLAGLDDGDFPIVECGMRIGDWAIKIPKSEIRIKNGGPYWTRTSDSLLKRQILYRLS